MMKITRRADLSQSARRKLNHFDAIIDSKTDKITPESCLKLLKYCSEERNAAVHGPLIKVAQ